MTKPSEDYPRTMFHRSLASVPLDQRNDSWANYTTIIASEAEEAALGAEWSRAIPPYEPDLPLTTEGPEPEPASEPAPDVQEKPPSRAKKRRT